MSTKLYIAIISVALLLSSCISDPGRCEDGGSNVFVSAGCIMGGGFNNALTEKRAEIARLRAARHLTDSEQEQIEKESNQLAGDVDAFHLELDRYDAELETLRQLLNESDPVAEEKQAMRAAMLEELASLQTQLDGKRSEGGAEEAEIKQLKEDVDKRRAVLDALAEEWIVE